jgi:hypothetical protein
MIMDKSEERKHFEEGEGGSKIQPEIELNMKSFIPKEV